MAEDKALTPPNAISGWSRQHALHNGAILVPFLSRGANLRPGGVITSDGEYLGAGALWRNGGNRTLPCDVPEVLGRPIRGRWLWGGFFGSHFGHFLTEAMSRIWALEYYENVSGVLFMPQQKRRDAVITEYQARLIELIDPSLRLALVKRPRPVKQLIVAGQALGIDALGPTDERSIARGTPEYRAFIKARFAKDIKASGPEKIFISRTKMGLPVSGLIGELELEERLTAEGYVPIHPETMSVDTQIARYKAARKIIITDGSAAHLLALLADDQQEIAYLLRRNYWVNAPIAQINSFSGRQVTVIDALDLNFVAAADEVPGRLSLFRLNIKLAWQKLAESGFVSASFNAH